MNMALMTAETGLADRFKKETWDLHTEAETTGFINQILRGTASLRQYIRFLENLKPVYETMESSSEWLTRFPALRLYIGDGIARTAAITHDLERLSARSDAHPPATLFPNTRSYQAHIQQAQRQDHPAMLAHIYVRYLGDVNGGLVLQRLLGQHLNLPADCLTFYNFPKIKDLSTFKTDFRAALNGISLNDRDEQHAIAAAKNAFRFNIELSKKLEEISGALA